MTVLENNIMCVPIIINIALYSEIFFDLNNNIIYINLYGSIALFFIDRFYRLNLNRVFLSKMSRHQ